MTKVYEIYDGNDTSLFSPDLIYEANTGKEAIMKMIKQKGYKILDIKRSRNNDVLFKAQAFYKKNGNKYKNGNAIWYKPI